MKYIFKTSVGDLHWGWKSIFLILGTILFGILLNALVVTALTIRSSLLGFSREQALQGAMVTSGGFIAQVILTFLQLSFMVWLVYLLITKVEKQKFDWSKLGLVSIDLQNYILLGVELALALSLITTSVGYLLGILKFLGNGFELFSPPQVYSTLLLSTVLAFASGFGEELAFRGYLQSRIAQSYNSTIAVIVAAVLFALSHPLPGNVEPVIFYATAILVGILFGTVFVYTGSLWMGIALHIVWNFMQIAILAVRTPDARFFGAPLLSFENIYGQPYILVEFGVILIVLLSVIWLMQPEIKRNVNVYKLR